MNRECATGPQNASGHTASAISLLYGRVKGDRQTGSEDDVVGFRSRHWRIGNIAVADGELPAQPLVNLGGCTGVECEKILACIRTQFRVKGKVFCQGGERTELMHESLTGGETQNISRHPRRESDGGCTGTIALTSVVGAGKQVEGGVRSVNGVITEAAAIDLLQIEELQLIMKVIRRNEEENLRVQIVAVTDSSEYRIRRNASSSRIVVGVVYGREVGLGFIVLGLAVPGKPEVKVGSVTVPPSQRETEVQAALPVLNKRRMQIGFVGLLLLGRADGLGIGQGHSYVAAGGMNHQVAGFRCCGSADGSLVGCDHEDRFVGGHCLHLRPLNGDDIRVVGLQYELFAVGAINRSDQVRSVIGDNRVRH